VHEHAEHHDQNEQQTPDPAGAPCRGGIDATAHHGQFSTNDGQVGDLYSG
jgi:hypothetical protein